MVGKCVIKELEHINLATPPEMTMKACTPFSILLLAKIPSSVNRCNKNCIHSFFYSMFFFICQQMQEFFLKYLKFGEIVASQRIKNQVQKPLQIVHPTRYAMRHASFYQIVKWSLFSNTHQPIIHMYILVLIQKSMLY